MLIIWGRLNSVNVQKVVWAAGECGLAFERRDAGMQFGINSSPDYRAKNPNGLIPLVEDGETIIWESHAIIRYLAATYAAGTLWAHDPAERSLADRWMDWTATAFNPAMNAAFQQTIRTPPEKRALLDAHLARQEFLAGAHVTMAECALGPFIHRWLNLPIKRQPHANVWRWYETIRARPAAVPALPLPVT
jgi:glutathione S-transferase